MVFRRGVPIASPPRERRYAHQAPLQEAAVVLRASPIFALRAPATTNLAQLWAATSAFHAPFFSAALRRHPLCERARLYRAHTRAQREGGKGNAPACETHAFRSKTLRAGWQHDKHSNMHAMRIMTPGRKAHWGKKTEKREPVQP